MPIALPTQVDRTCGRSDRPPCDPAPPPPRPAESAVRYRAPRRKFLWAGGLVSLGVHAALLLAFNRAGRPEFEAANRTEYEQIDLFQQHDETPPPPPKPEDEAAAEEEIVATNPQDLAAASLPEPVASMAIDSVPMEIGPPPPPVPPRADALANFAIPQTQSRAISSGTAKHLQVFSLDELDKRPEAVVQSAPGYPFDLKQQGIQGEVVLRFIVDRTGRVIDPNVVHASHPRFGEPALQAILRWRFKPGIKAGRAVNTRMELPMRFKLES